MAMLHQCSIKKMLRGGGTHRFTLEKPEHTVSLGKALAAVLKGGDAVLLSGELGAGKTVLTKGIALGLGITAPVVSPTFTIMNEYPTGGVKLCHFDAYRLADADEARGAGLTDFIGNPECICAVEWWQNISPLFEGLHTVSVKIEKTGDNSREVEITL